MRAILISILSLSLSLFCASHAAAQVSFFNDSSGTSGTIITPGDGGISFYNDSRGNTGTIITPGGRDSGSISFYNFSGPGGMTSGTVQSFGAPDSRILPVIPAPAPRQSPAPYSGFGSSRVPGWQR
jgi:hypothetical protein